MKWVGATVPLAERPDMAVPQPAGSDSAAIVSR